MYLFSAETKTDAVLSDLVQRNAKFSCTVGVYWPVCSNSLDTEKVAVTRGKHVWKTVSFTSFFYKQRKAMGDCLSV